MKFMKGFRNPKKMPKDKRKEEKVHFRQGLVLQHSKGQHLLINPRLLFLCYYAFAVLF